LAELEQNDDNEIDRWLFGSDAAVSHHSCVAGLASGLTSRHFTRHDQRNFTEDLQRRSSLPLGCRGCGYLRNHFGFHSEWRN
jgi:hypothetical protein